MSVVNKKESSSKIVRRIRAKKLDPHVKYIGLKEKMDEAERIFKSLENPELLRS